jgi:Bacterial Ig domain/Beta-galactosidase
MGRRIWPVFVVDPSRYPAYRRRLSSQPPARVPRPTVWLVVPALILVVSVLTVAVATRPARAEGVPYTGVSVRQWSATSITDTSIDHTAHPELRLVSPMVSWRALEPSEGVFDFGQLDRDVQDAATNDYRLWIRVMAGRMVPDWLLASGGQTLRVLGTDPNAPDFCDWIDVLVPWDQVLEAEYRQMMSALGSWLQQSDGIGGTNADHVYLVPISMPTLLGSEMTIGFGSTVTCPAGTDGAGASLWNTNASRWHTLGTNAQLQSWTEGAWRDAIAIHMQELPAQVHSLLTYGGVFGDAQAAALDLARTEIGPNRDRLWSMYTNLQPLVTNGSIAGVWKDWCPACHDTVMAALSAGGQVGFQIANTSNVDAHAEMVTAVDDAITRYAPRFLETSRERIDAETSYLLTGTNSVQQRLAANAAKVLSASSLACNTVQIGSPSTCTIHVNEVWDDPTIVPSGQVSVTAGGLGTQNCDLDASGSCQVSFTPPSAGPVAVTATYPGDDRHLSSTATGSIATATRPSSVSLACGSPVVAGQGSACTVTVTDAGSGSTVTPSGTVGWSVPGGGSLNTSQCTLSGGAGAAACGATYTPTVSGTTTVTATYAGSSTHDGGSAGAAVVATARGTSTSVTCAPASVGVGTATSCTVTVSDVAGAGATGPTGTVSWSTSGPGSFGASTCALGGSGTSRTCTVSYTASAGGSPTIGATYGGDAAHAGSSGSVTITVTVPDTTKPTVQITAPTNGSTVPKAKTTTIAATASDDRGVIRVEFRVSGALKCTDTTAPYTCPWAVPKQANVTYTLVATAFDAAGNNASASATVKSR